MADTTQTAQPEPAEAGRPTRDDRRAKRLAHQIAGFARAHGGGVEGQLAHIGRGRVRIALVAADGEWGTLVAPSREVAERAAAAAELALHDDFDGDLASKMRTGPYEWVRMAGMQLGGPRNA